MFAVFRTIPLNWLNVYIMISFAAVFGVVAEAFSRHQHFYATVVFLSSSTHFPLLLGNVAIAGLVTTWQICKRIFFGELVPLEKQQLTEWFMYTAIELLLTLSEFRSEGLGKGVLITLALTMMMSAVHFIADLRGSAIEREGSLNRWALFKLVFCLTVCTVVDIAAVNLFLSEVLEKNGDTVMVLPLLEFVINYLRCGLVTFKLLLYLIEMKKGDLWEPRGPLKFYAEMFHDLGSAACFFISFYIITTKRTLPYHLIRRLIVRGANAWKTVKHFLHYRRLMGHISKTFADATPEELQQDRTCSICYDEMLDGTHCKKLPCRHMYHRHCLRQWFEKNSNCPYCRDDVLGLMNGRGGAARRAGQQQEQPPAAAGVQPDGAPDADAARVAEERAAARAAMEAMLGGEAEQRERERFMAEEEQRTGRVFVREVLRVREERLRREKEEEEDRKRQRQMAERGEIRGGDDEAKKLKEAYELYEKLHDMTSKAEDVANRVNAQMAASSSTQAASAASASSTTAAATSFSSSSSPQDLVNVVATVMAETDQAKPRKKEEDDEEPKRFYFGTRSNVPPAQDDTATASSPSATASPLMTSADLMTGFGRAESAGHRQDEAFVELLRRVSNSHREAEEDPVVVMYNYRRMQGQLLAYQAFEVEVTCAQENLRRRLQNLSGDL